MNQEEKVLIDKESKILIVVFSLIITVSFIISSTALTLAQTLPMKENKHEKVKSISMINESEDNKLIKQEID